MCGQAPHATVVKTSEREGKREIDRWIDRANYGTTFKDVPECDWSDIGPIDE